jgi:hypothetical protein
MKSSMKGMLAAAVACAAMAAVGCSGSDDPAPGGTSSSGSSGATSSSSGSSGSSGASSSSGSSGATGSLYERLGKKEGIAKAVSAIVAEELKDEEIKSYFYFQIVKQEGPTPAQIEECLVNQLGSAAGGPEAEVKYPTMVSGGFMCRSMIDAHKRLSIPAGVFDKFIMIAGGVLKSAGVAEADITTIANVLVGTKADVAQDTKRQTGPFVPPEG